METTMPRTGDDRPAGDALYPPADVDARIDALAARIAAARREGARLTIRGGGTKAFLPRLVRDALDAGEVNDRRGQRSPPEPLDLRALAGIVSYEPSELYVTALAGTPLAALEAELARHGQCLPFEPPHYAHGLGIGAGAGVATVGGMVASGFSGPARASVGALRDHVLGVTLIDGRGQRLVFGGQVMKNVAGYDVSRLVCGAFGALGVIASVSLKVLPIAPAEATLKFSMSQDEALKNLNAWGGRPLPLNASCWVDDDGVSTLYLRLRGAARAVESACRTLGGERQGDAAKDDWNACRDHRLPWFADRSARHEVWRVSVPTDAPALAVPNEAGPPLVEWHGGLRWYQAPPAAASAIVRAAEAVGGSATLFIASESQNTWATGQFDSKNTAQARIEQALKREFDPGGVFDAPSLVTAA